MSQQHNFVFYGMPEGCFKLCIFNGNNSMSFEVWWLNVDGWALTLRRRFLIGLVIKFNGYRFFDN
jgi:hypothetical protein